MKLIYEEYWYRLMEIPKFSFKTQKDEAYEFYKNNGAVIFTDLIDKSLINDARNELKELIQMQIGKHLDKTKQLMEANGFDEGFIEYSNHDENLRERFYNISKQLPSLHQIAGQKHVINACKELGIEKPLLDAPQFRIDKPQDSRFLIKHHQETRGTKSTRMINMITAVSDIPKERGALSIALGSQKLGPISPTFDDSSKYQYIDPKYYEKDYPPQQAPLKAGETLMFNMYLCHGSMPNVTNATRWQIIVRVEDGTVMPYLDGEDVLDEKFNLEKVRCPTCNSVTRPSLAFSTADN